MASPFLFSLKGKNMAGHGLPRSIPDVYARLNALEGTVGDPAEIEIAEITGAGGTVTIPAGDLQTVLQAIVDQIDPGA